MRENVKRLPYRKYVSEYWRDFGKIAMSFLMLIALLIAGSIVSRGYSEMVNLLLRMKVASFVGILGMVQATIIITGGGGIDVSVGTMASLGALFGASVMQGRNEMALPAMLLAAAMGLVLGLINGYMIAYMQIHPLIQTLAMSYVITGIIVAYSQGKMLLGKPAPMIESLANGKIGAWYVIILIWMVLVMLMELMLRHTKTGHKLLCVGANDKAALLSGVNVQAFRMKVYGFSGLVSAVFGVILLGYVHTVYLDVGNQYMFPSVVACAIGGISLAGGSGSYVGVFGGTLVYTFLQSFLVTINMNEAWRKAFFGIILVVVLVIYARSNKER